MDIKDQQKHWDAFGRQDPMWAICTDGPRDNQWDTARFFETGERVVEAIMNQCALLRVPVHRGRALDFGCGIGRLTQPLCGYFKEVYGIDVAPSMIQQAESFNRHGASCQYCVNEDYDLAQFEDESFDFIVTYSVLQHIEPQYVKRYLKAFLRILKPDGLLVFQEHAAPRRFVPRVKNAIKTAVPKPVLAAYKRMKYAAAPGPIMEVYGIQRGRLIAFLRRNGGEILDVSEAVGASGGWKTFQYIVRKPRLCPEATSAQG
jgi:SAM-dependent methyltransferase